MKQFLLLSTLLSILWPNFAPMAYALNTSISNTLTITVEVPSTPALTARQTGAFANAWSAPVDLTLSTNNNTFPLPLNFPGTFRQTDFDSPNALVLLKSDAVTMRILATYTNNAHRVRTRVLRNPNDLIPSNPVFGFTENTPPAADGGTMTTNQSGSFYIHSWYDQNDDGAYNTGEISAVFPVIIVSVLRVTNLCSVTLSNQHLLYYRSPSNIAQAWTDSSIDSSLNLNGVDYHAATFEAVYTLFGGGQDLQLGTDRVFAGWTQQLSSVPTYLINYSDGTTILKLKGPLATNDTAASATYTRGAFTYKMFVDPNDAAAISISLPILDCLHNPIGVGANSIGGALTKLEEHAAPGNIGQRLKILSADSPHVSASKAHPHNANCTMNYISKDVSYQTFLTFWTSTTTPAPGGPLPAPQRPSGPNNKPGERTYYDGECHEWGIGAGFTVDANGAGTADARNSMIGPTSHIYGAIVPASVQIAGVPRHETRPPAAQHSSLQFNTETR